MRRKSLASGLLASTLLTYAATVVVIAAVTTLAVYPGNLEGWQIETAPGAQPSPSATPSVAFVEGPCVPLLGIGSVELRVGSDGGAIASVRHPGYEGIVLPNSDPDPTPDPSPTPPPPEEAPAAPAAPNEISVLGYSTYVPPGSPGSLAPNILLQIDYNDDGIPDDLLHFEPRYQNGTYPVVDPSITIPDQCGANPSCITPDVWQTWDALNGGWWAASAGTAGPPLTTLRFYRAQHPGARIINLPSGLGGVRVVAGGGTSEWDNFVGYVDAFRIGTGDDPDVGPTTTLYDFEPNAPPTQSSAGVIITELRASGPGLSVEEESPGAGSLPTLDAAEIGGGEGDGVEPKAPPCCDGDEYVELYNTSDTDILVQSSDGSAGWALVQRGATCLAEPEVVAIIPNGTLIPARGHYLLVGNEYSLDTYPAGIDAGAEGDQPLSGTLEDDRNVALFNTSDPLNFSLETRLDAVGFDAGSGGVCELLSEGTKLPPERGDISEHAYVRKYTTVGSPQDTGDNAADFEIVSTTPDQSVGDEPFPILGAPGPENTSSPTYRTNDEIAENGIAPGLSRSAAPNRTRDFTAEPCASQGSLYIRRTFTNNTGAPVTRLRFRIRDITTYNNDGGGAFADLRVLDSADEVIEVPDRGTVNVAGLSLEQPPFQPPPFCGGLNSSLSADHITLNSPLAPGASTDIVFRFGVERGGAFRAFVVIEALNDDGGPAPPQ